MRLAENGGIISLFLQTHLKQIFHYLVQILTLSYLLYQIVLKQTVLQAGRMIIVMELLTMMMVDMVLIRMAMVYMKATLAMRMVYLQLLIGVAN